MLLLRELILGVETWNILRGARIRSKTGVLLSRWLSWLNAAVIWDMKLESNCFLIQQVLDNGVSLILVALLKITVCLKHLLANEVISFAEDNFDLFLFRSIHLVQVALLQIIGILSHLFGRSWTCRCSWIVSVNRALQEGRVDVFGKRLVWFS